MPETAGRNGDVNVFAAAAPFGDLDGINVFRRVDDAFGEAEG